MLLSSSSKLEAVIVVALVIHMMIGALSRSSDHLALLEIKSKITHDPHGALASWNDSLPFCQWRGVTCGRRNRRVTILNLQDMGLVGSLSPYLGNMSFLGNITLNNNLLHGRIPPEIGRLYRLQVLSLINNLFTGEIPVNMSSWPKLSYLNLEFNKLSGKIPNTFSSKLMINFLSFAKNDLTGGIPPSIGNLTSLETLFLSFCRLGGSIPGSLNQLKNLREIGLGENDLVGAFPSFLFNLLMLQLLNLPENQLQGSLPSNFCLSQPHLTKIELGMNHFNGFLPPSISNCSELEILDVSTNDLKGEIAIDFGRLQHLSLLYLVANYFESKDLDAMKIFHSLSNYSNLKNIDLSSNLLRGVLPNSLGNFSSKLAYLGMHSNYISGSIPSSIGNLLGLTSVSIGQNNFTCIIPDSIGKLQNLQQLYLDTNHLSGVIPTSPLLGVYLGNLSLLSSLSIVLDLSQNNLSGVLPQEIGNLKLLESLDFSMNRFTSELPSSLSRCISLQKLNLSGNFFYGSMPESYSSLKGLKYVDLSRNNFSGHIPTYLQQIPLIHLNLSYNNFEGDVPVKGVFANTSAISVVGNPRLCGGIPELHLPKCTSKTSDSKRRTRKLSIRVVVAISLSSTIADFGLAKILSLEEGSINANMSSSSVIRGTIGYAPPVSTSGDIYSYGILLLKMLTGKKPIDPMFEGGPGLHSYARSALADGFVLHIVDPMLLNEDVNEQILISLVNIGVQCSCESLQDRMDIGTVVHELFATTDSLAHAVADEVDGILFALFEE
ncbi:hypothetical protein L1987_35308 [Smallanthus sonchifolius]|uniref:Uncharacterized protein n=1 Tax=Smallanthus sonchifolius TaxID=185202 RepID=A0ACB9HW01_9ASTR|nr:hypothetical protein L1987_35308 [Smallanthus sonchifolius]